MSDRDEKWKPKSAKEITVSGEKKSNQEMVCIVTVVTKIEEKIRKIT